MAGFVRRWPIAQAWEAATEVVAAAHRLEPQALRAESRGRGPRPPEHVWMPRKIALQVTVILADCDYAVLARELRLSKDTVSTHCAAVRDACADDPGMEARVDALVTAAMARLDTGATVRVRADEDAGQVALLMAVLARLDRIEAELRRLTAHPTSSDEPPPSSDAGETDHRNVIALDLPREEAA